MRLKEGYQPFPRGKTQSIAHEPAIPPELRHKRFLVQDIGKVAAPPAACKQFEGRKIPALEDHGYPPVFPERQSSRQSGGSGTDDRNFIHMKHLQKKDLFFYGTGPLIMISRTD